MKNKVIERLIHWYKYRKEAEHIFVTQTIRYNTDDKIQLGVVTLKDVNIRIFELESFLTPDEILKTKAECGVI